jgi:hypothetical protein
MDAWKWIALGFLILGVAVLPVFSYSLSWSIYPSLFCGFVAVLVFLVSIFSKRGSAIWRDRGQG